MGRAIIKSFETEAEAKAYLQGVLDSKDYLDFSEDDWMIIDDRDYNGKFTVNIL